MADHDDPTGDGGDGRPMQGGGRRSRQWAFGTVPRPRVVAITETEASLAHRDAIAIRLDRPTPSQRAVQATIAREQDVARASLGGPLDPRRAMAIASELAGGAWMRARPTGATRYENDPRAQPVTRYENDPRAQPVTRYVDGPRAQPVTRYVDGPRAQPVTRYVDGPRAQPVTRYATDIRDVYGGYAPPRPEPRADGGYATGLVEASGPTWTPAVAPARYDTTAMLGRYVGEHLPGNKVWRGTVKYLGVDEREARRVIVRDGRLHWLDGTPVDTSSAKSAFVGGGGRAIFVMDRQGNLYASTFHKAGQFHHSSLLAGGPVAAAGEMEVQDGVLTLLTDRSGHYRPGPSLMEQLFAELEHQGVPLDAVQYPGDGEDTWVSAQQAADAIRNARRPPAASGAPATPSLDGAEAPGAAENAAPGAVQGRPEGESAGAHATGGDLPSADGAGDRRGAGDRAGGDQRGGERSGEAEARGDEPRLGRRGEAARGAKTAYARWVRAFGRDPEGARAGFQEHWERVAQERAASAMAQDAARVDPAMQVAAQLHAAYGAANAAADPAADAAGSAPAGAGSPTRRRPATRRVRVWVDARARHAAANLRRLADAFRASFRRPRPGGATMTAPAWPGGGRWPTVDDGMVLDHPPPAADEVKANINRVDRIKYREAIPGSNATLGFFKPEPTRDQMVVVGHNLTFTEDGQPPRLASRAVLSSVLDRALGTGALAVEVFGRHDNPVTGVTEIGNVSAAVPGRALLGNLRPDGETPNRDPDMQYVLADFNTSVDLRSPETQRGLSNLQTLDWITGQTDRHEGNIFVADDGTVSGIDNDFAFSSVLDPRLVGDSKNVGMPTIMHAPTADAVLGLSGSDLEKLLQASAPPGQRLTDAEIAAAKIRLGMLKTGIKNGSIQVVESFDRTSTFDRLRTPRDDGSPSSYLDKFASQVESVVANGKFPVPINDMTGKMTVGLEDMGFDPAVWAPSDSPGAWAWAPGSPFDDGAPALPVSDEAWNRRGSEALAEAGVKLRDDAAAAGSMPTIDGSAPAAAAIGDVATGVEANVRRGRSASESQAAGATDRASRGSFTLKRRSHAGTSARTDAKKTPARGTKDRRSMPVTRTKRKKG